MIENKYKNLTIGIVLDAIGYLSFIFPLFDIVWAPLSAYLMTTMYKGRKGKIAAAITFIEEAMPFLDIIPTFTIMWFYTYVIDKKKSETVVDA
ncbi:MAG: hypothetical protein QMB29_00365 [Urechidicola sp.]|jgi:hypothetical protein